MNSYKSLSITNQKEVNKLLRSIENCNDEWSLFYLKCNYQILCEQVVNNLEHVKIPKIYLEKDAVSLHSSINNQIHSKKIQALIILGLESIENIEKLLKSTIQERDKLRRQFKFPIYIFITDTLQLKLAKGPQDFNNEGVPICNFTMTEKELIEFIQQVTDEAFKKVEEAGSGKLFQRINDKLNLSSVRINELIYAKKELINKNVYINNSLKASLEFAIGLGNDNIPKICLRHYIRSAKFFEKTDNLIRLGFVKFYIGRCHRKYADLHNNRYKKSCLKSKLFYQQCIEIFESEGRLDLVVKFINALGDVLHRLHKWIELEQTARKALFQMNGLSGDKFRLARAYGFLAQVTKSNSKWENTISYSERALDIFREACIEERNKKIPDEDCLDWEESFHYGWYLLPLSQAICAQGNKEQALEILIEAKRKTKPQYDARLYIEILECMYKLYISNKKYLKSFFIKQERLEIQQQFGFRTFIGIGRLQPQKRVVNLANHSFIQQERIAEEIITFGREQNVYDLKKRLSETFHNLTIIYGPSGSGKTSLLQAGLIPVLNQQLISNRKYIPILRQDYSNWIEKLGDDLYKFLLPQDISTVKPPLNSIDKIIRAINDIQKKEVSIVFIFDNLEELFSSRQDLNTRHLFYQFLGQCLHIPYVKVILSLREDLLHHLLDFQRMVNLTDINNDILCRDNLYYLGYVLLDNIKLRLTFFSLEQDLINQLIVDLSSRTSSHQGLLIELKIVGTQIENLGIQTLIEYKKFGENPKETLIEKFLEDITSDCGDENKSIAELLLYLLTDENNHPLLINFEKLKEGLILSERISSLSDDQIIEVLEILIHSGLIKKYEKANKISYQLIHEYFVRYIRNLFLKNHKDLFGKLNRTIQQFNNDVLFKDIQKLNLESKAFSLRYEQLLALNSSLEAANKCMEIGLSKDDFIAFSDNMSNIKSEKVFKETLETLKQVIYTICEYKILEHHKSDVNSLCFSYDNKLLASASLDKCINIWNVCEGELLYSLIDRHCDFVNSIKFSLDGKYIVSGGADCKLKISKISWDSSRKKFIFNDTVEFDSHSDWIWEVCFNKQGNMIASASGDKLIYLWSFVDHSWKKFKTLSKHENKVYSVCFSPISPLLVSSSEIGRIRLWNIQTGECLHTFSANHDEHRDGVKSVRFSPDGSLIAAASNDHMIYLWEVSNPHKLIKTFQGHNDSVNSVSFRFDGRVLASGSDDNTVRLWSLDGDLLKTLRGHRDWVKYVEFSPNGEILASASDDNTIKLWKLDLIVPTNLFGHKGKVHGLCFTQDGKIIASGGWDGTICLWGLNSSNTWDQIRDPIVDINNNQMQEPNWIWEVSISPDGEILASGGGDCQIKLWKSNGLFLRVLGQHEDCIHSIRFSPDNKYIASASGDKSIKIWDYMNNRLIAICKGHNDKVWGVSFSPDSQLIISASGDNIIKLWNLKGECLYSFIGHHEWVNSIIFSSDGKYIVSASNDTTVKIWDIEGNCIRTLRGHNSKVYDVAFSPNGDIIASASADKTINLWNFKDGTLLKTLEGHSDWVNSIMFSPKEDELLLASASNDGTVKLWDLKPIKEQLKSWSFSELITKGNQWLNRE